MRSPIKCADCLTVIVKGDPLAEPRYGVCPRCRSRRGGRAGAAIKKKNATYHYRKGGADARSADQ